MDNAYLANRVGDGTEDEYVKGFSENILSVDRLCYIEISRPDASNGSA